MDEVSATAKRGTHVKHLWIPQTVGLDNEIRVGRVALPALSRCFWSF